MWSVIAASLLLASLVAGVTPPRFEIRPDDAWIDEPIAIRVAGLPARGTVVIGLRGWGDAPQWSSSATFVADDEGVVDLTRMAPSRGDYEGVEAMGLFWSTHHAGSAPSAFEREIDPGPPPPQIWHLTASVGGTIVASASLTRRIVAADVRISAVRSGGLRGFFYEPSSAGRHPTVVVLSGSGGGAMPPSSFPGGLASRGYDVLALAYFGVADLPPSLHDIPLEYFATALEWLTKQPSVDSDRLAVLGISRGGELALLLGSIFPQIHAVVAYVPSNIVVGGCCNSRSESSWTAGGRPLAWAFPAGRDSVAAERAAIRVEQIHGAVLLISGRADHVWPSTEMANAVMARLERNHFAYPHQHLAYAAAGHGFGRPYTSTMEIDRAVHPLTHRTLSLGGTPAGTAKAREDSWRHVLTFLQENLAGR